MFCTTVWSNRLGVAGMRQIKQTLRTGAPSASRDSIGAKSFTPPLLSTPRSAQRTQQTHCEGAKREFFSDTFVDLTLVSFDCLACAGVTLPDLGWPNLVVFCLKGLREGR